MSLKKLQKEEIKSNLIKYRDYRGKNYVRGLTQGDV